MEVCIKTAIYDEKQMKLSSQQMISRTSVYTTNLYQHRRPLPLDDHPKSLLSFVPSFASPPFSLYFPSIFSLIHGRLQNPD